MRIHHSFFLLLTVLASSCTPIALRSVDPADSLREFRQDIISSNTLSPMSLQALRMVGLTQEQALEEGVSAEDKAKFEQFAEKIDLAYVESEIAIGRAQIVEKTSPEKAIALYLHAADLALQGFFISECKVPLDIRCDSFKVFYERAVRGIIAYETDRQWSNPNQVDFDTGVGRHFTLELAADSKLEDPQEYKTIVPSASIGLEGLTNRYRRSGIGVSLTACRPRRDNSPQEQYLPKVGVCLPLTAVLRFPAGGCTGAQCKASLELIDSIASDSISVGATKVPLAADFSAPFASMIDKTGLGSWDGLFSAFEGNEELLQSTGFYTLEPYNSGKIPLLTVHGLFSNPITWMDLHNDLMGDPIIRNHFQVWHYLYPTNLPIIENAKTFREKLDQLDSYIASTAKAGSFPPGMVIVAHSMGGILTRTAVIQDSKPLRDYLFEDAKRVDELDDETRAALDSYLNFSRKPYINRVIFVAVPHRGSDLADNWIGRIGRALITLPQTVLRKTAVVARKARNVIRPDLQSSFDSDDHSSVKGLSKSNPILMGFSKLSIDPNVPYHSIIGDQGKGDTPNSSDGVVEYSSSHLDGAASELIVPADHTAHASPRAVHEIRRILRLHLDSLDADRKS
jgi:triacylglycerol esterase/lipase EstA (alpha/beta hydrolase family)